jgi:hypothetical protein
MLWLLIIPLARGLVRSVLSPARLMAWLEEAWFGIAVLLFAATFSMMRWRGQRYAAGGKSLVFHDGFLLRKIHTADREKIISASAMRASGLESQAQPEISFFFMEKDKARPYISFILSRQKAYEFIKICRERLLYRFGVKELRFTRFFLQYPVWYLITALAVGNFSKLADVEVDKLILSVWPNQPGGSAWCRTFSPWRLSPASSAGEGRSSA